MQMHLDQYESKGNYFALGCPLSRCFQEEANLCVSEDQIWPEPWLANRTLTGWKKTICHPLSEERRTLWAAIQVRGFPSYPLLMLRKVVRSFLWPSAWHYITLAYKANDMTQFLSSGKKKQKPSTGTLKYLQSSRTCRTHCRQMLCLKVVCLGCSTEYFSSDQSVKCLHRLLVLYQKTLKLSCISAGPNYQPDWIFFFFLRTYSLDSWFIKLWPNQILTWIKED